MKNDKLKYNKNNMKPSLKTKPHNYAYCFATNEQCPQRRECLHALVAELPMKASRTPEVVICSIDPRYIATLEGKGGCALFRSSTPSRYACGMSQLYDEVPSKVVSQVRWKVQRCSTSPAAKAKSSFRPTNRKRSPPYSVNCAPAYSPYTTGLKRHTNGDMPHPRIKNQSSNNQRVTSLFQFT